jgi:hypothetical protein
MKENTTASQEESPWRVADEVRQYTRMVRLLHGPCGTHQRDSWRAHNHETYAQMGHLISCTNKLTFHWLLFFSLSLSLSLSLGFLFLWCGFCYRHSRRLLLYEYVTVRLLGLHDETYAFYSLEIIKSLQVYIIEFRTREIRVVLVVFSVLGRPQLYIVIKVLDTCSRCATKESCYSSPAFWTTQ